MVESLPLWRKARAAIAHLHLCFLCFQTRRVPMTSVRKPSREDREKAQERLQNTLRAHYSVQCVTWLLSGPPSPLLPLSWKIQRGHRTHPSSVTVAPDQPVSPCDLQESVSGEGFAPRSRQSSRKQESFGILARKKAEFHEVRDEDPGWGKQAQSLEDTDPSPCCVLAAYFKTHSLCWLLCTKNIVPFFILSPACFVSFLYVG